MNKRGFVFLLLFLVSEVLGIVLGEAGFRLYRVTMPPAAVSAFNLGNAHMWYITSGIGVGLVIFLWSIIAALLGRVAFAPAKPAATPSAPSAPPAPPAPKPGA